MEEDGQCVGVDIYSSKTIAWIFKESKLGEEAKWTLSKSTTVFLNGCLHYIGFYEGYHHNLAVDMEEKAWRKIPNWPRGFHAPSIKLRVTCVNVLLMVAICLSFQSGSLKTIVLIINVH
jgi:hypothetical protein